MTYLPDVNVWVALAVEQHVHHGSATRWFEASADDTFAFCRVTQMGLLRLLTNQRVMGPDALTTARSWSVVDSFLCDSRIALAPEPTGLERIWRGATHRDPIGPNFWTDAYLAAFAAAGSYALVTFDHGLRNHRGARVRVLE